ncbi:MAG TPA: DNA polymerase I, partial [Phycisphaerales bacterium]|nr:DNA polymerase I [Phycisphaerales bacterium]
MAESAVKTLYLIDGHAQFFRAYFAIRTRMTSPVTGEPTNMTYGYVGMLLKLLREYKPDYLAVVIDVSGDKETFRSEIYPAYKAHREEPPEELRPQIDRCLKVMELMGIPVFGEETVEADDVIASIVKRLKREQPNLKIRIVSKDKDLTQLLNDRVELFDVHKDSSVTAADVFGVEGVQPQHVRDILALMGDTSDNIPGVQGIGPKTASQLILKYGSLENLLAHQDELKGKQRENLHAAGDVLNISKQLVTLKDDLPIEFDLERARVDVARLPTEAMLAVFRELGFNRFPDELAKITGAPIGTPAQSAASRRDSQPALAANRTTDGFADSLFGGTEPQEEQAQTGETATLLFTPTDPGDYHCVSTLKQLDALIKRLRSCERFAIDTETDSLSPVSANLCGISIALKTHEAYYIPVRSPEPQTHLDTATVIDRLRPILEDGSTLKIGHNLKFDLNVLRRHGVRIAPASTAKNVGFRGFDTMIASYVIDASRSSHRMDVLALALLNHTCIPIDALIGKGKQQRRFDEAPLSMAVPYAAEDADITLRLHDVLAPQIKAMGLTDLFENLEMPLVEVLAELEWNGIRVDPDELDRQRENLAKRINTLRREISNAAPFPFNPDSPKQLAAVLFNKPDQEPPGLGIKPLKRGKTGPSTDVEVLEKLAADEAVESDLPRLIVEYRQLTKLVNTYLVALKEAINPETKRVHASFNQTVAATGRLSSSDPNLQNIPIRTEVGREIRRAFVAEPGNVLITADYSQIELRILAHLSEDPALIEAFEQGQDIHTAVAAEVYGIPLDRVTSTQRNSAKMVNFGIVYGITAYGLARRLGAGTSVEEAARIIHDYKARFNRIDAFLAQCIDMAKSKGYVETMLKRRRAIPQIHARNPQQKQLGERMAINSVVQGSAADLIKLAMIDLHRAMPARFPAVKMVLQIHDELVFEAPAQQADEATK